MSTARVVSLQTVDAELESECKAASTIVNAIKAGDPHAETDLVERYSRGLRYILLRRVGDDERARDLLHDTFCIALEKLRSVGIEQPERLAGWLRGIAIRVAQNDGRRRRREPDPVDRDAIAAVPDAALSSFRLLSNEQLADVVRQLLDSMPVERDRELLMRYYVYDQDKEEICAALELDSLHFNRVLYRAKGRFRNIVQKSELVAGIGSGQ